MDEGPFICDAAFIDLFKSILCYIWGFTLFQNETIHAIKSLSTMLSPSPWTSLCRQRIVCSPSWIDAANLLAGLHGVYVDSSIVNEGLCFKQVSYIIHVSPRSTSSFPLFLSKDLIHPHLNPFKVN